MPAWINLGAVPVGQAGIEGGDERVFVHVTADDAHLFFAASLPPVKTEVRNLKVV